MPDRLVLPAPDVLNPADMLRCRGVGTRLVQFRRSVLIRVAVILVGWGLVGARNPAASNQSPLVLLADRDYPPLSFLRNGGASGRDLDIARAISDRLGREVRVTLMDWAVAQEKVLRGEADGVLSMSLSPERDPFATAAGGIAVRKGNVEALASINRALREIKANGTLEAIEARWRPSEMLFVSRQRIVRLVALGGVAALAAFAIAMTIWVFIVTRQARARQAAETALVESERRLRDLLTKAETELAKRRETERRLRLLAHALQSESDCVCMTDTTDHILYVKEGRRVTLELNVRPLQGESARTGVQGIARDVTARKELEAQLRQSQKMEAIGRLAGGIAHDFNNLLTVIVGYSDLVRAELPQDSAIQEDVAEIRRAANSAESLTRQLLIFSRKDVVQPAVLDLNKSVDRLERMLRRIVGEDIEFIVRQARDVGCIKADAGQIDQVIMNLVVNARDAMPAGGTLTIETSVVEIDSDWARAHPGSAPGSFVRLAVADTGHGMTPEVQAQIFTPFFTTKGPSTGTGLGLATVHGIVQQSGGWIGVTSAAGKGTRVFIYLPRIAESVELEAHATASSGPSPVVSGTILFVEDDESIRALGARTLRQQGFTVLTARHANEALHVAKSPDLAIHLLLTDIVMPGISGRELASQLQRSRPSLRVLYTSGYTDDSAALRDIQVSGPAFIPKPYSPDLLVRRVRSVLSGS